MAKINLNITTVENREMRLGTIIGWEGNATELIRQSAYDIRSLKKHGECAAAGGGCKLCELPSPLNQETMCSNAIVQCQVGNLTDCVLIDHSPIGCSSENAKFNLSMHVGLSRRGKPLQNTMNISTNLKERDMVFGASDKLRNTIREAKERFDPKAIFIGMACATAIIGEDIDSIAEEMEPEVGVPVIPLHCEGFRSKHWSTGFDIAFHGVLRQIVDRHPKKKQKDLINIVALWGTDYFTDMLKPLGLRVNYLLDCASFDEIKQASEAVATATFCNTLGGYMATALEENFSVLQIDAPQPYGIKGTDEWLRAIAKVVGKEKEVEEFIESEHKRIEPKLKEFREYFKGKYGIVMTGSAYAHGLITVLAELGIGREAALVFHHDPIYDGAGKKQDTLKELVETYGEIPYYTVSKTRAFQLPQLLKRAKADFLIIRHPGLASVSGHLGFPTLAMGDEHIPVGYDGILRVGEILKGVLARTKFNQLLKRHVKLPYNDWWIKQDDPFLLSNHPEVLDDIAQKVKANY
ncbi:MAG TPA: nitrogenase component 1 [Paludibacteraceae bacterium]|nr:nitrogenase component 1 [Paludibacteraceae bacterium]HOU68655.1 nitrogenase component 1 [Paludibacteraceae bacterium]HQF50490.1 nitrogenase component 1 [Paludibacteraceae bacterium]HQJ89278.1 nitrogenase component 1 [Paludibacteraceae bacterium]